MKWSPWLSMACAAAVLAFGPGCLITHHSTNIVRKNEKPRAVVFESPQAKNIFDGKVVEVRANQTSLNNPHVIAVPFLLWWSSTDVVSDNGIYNDQVAICDTNGDGVITLDEATIYAARVDEQIAKHQAEKAKLEAQAGNTAPAPSGRDTASSDRDNVSGTAAVQTQPASLQQPLEARQPAAPMPGGSYR